MDAFCPTPPPWTKKATHALSFCCPSCQSPPSEADNVWLNRRSPVIKEDGRRQWQEFYHCNCGVVWWGWSCDRSP